MQKESEVVEWKLRPDHVDTVISIPRKYPVSKVVEYMKGKNAIWVARATERNRNFVGKRPRSLLSSIGMMMKPTL